MTLPVTERKAGPYSCNGSLVAFDFAFKVFTEADIRVVLTSAAGVETVLVLTTNYTVALNADQENDPGGTITTVSTYATGYLITIDGALTYGQPTELTNLGAFFPKVIERALDRLSILIQQLKKLTDRSLKIGVSDSIGSTEIPSAAQRASKALVFDANGDFTVASVTTTVYGQIVERFTATASQTVFTLSNLYIPGVNAVAVFQNGLRLRGSGIDYTETSTSVITLTTGATVGDEIDIVIGQEAASSASLASAVAYQAAAAGASATNVQAVLRERVSVIQFGAVGDGVDTNEMPEIRAALVANPKRDVFVPAGRYLGATPLLIGGPTAFDYHSLVGEGFPNYYGNGSYGSTLEFTTGSGVLINNGYQNLSGLNIRGTLAGGSNPVTNTLGNVGLKLSGGAFHGGSSNIEKVLLENWDTAIAIPSGQFLAYDEIKSPYIIGATTGWAVNGVVTDLHVVGGKTVSCTSFGLYVSSESYKNINFTNHLFEGCGTVGVSKTSAGIRVDDITSLTLHGCYFELCNICAATRKATIELSGRCYVNSAIQLFGPGTFIIGENSLGQKCELDVVRDITNAAWTKTNCTAVLLDNLADPYCYQIQSSAAAGTIPSISTTIQLGGIKKINPRKITNDGTTVKHWLYARVYLRWQSAGPADGVDWIGNNGFLPVLSARSYDASSDGFALTNTDSTLWNFSDNTWWPVNLFVPLRWGAPYITGALKEVVLTLQFAGAGGPAYNVSALDVHVRIDEVALFQAAF